MLVYEYNVWYIDGIMSTWTNVYFSQFKLFFFHFTKLPTQHTMIANTKYSLKKYVRQKQYVCNMFSTIIQSFVKLPSATFFALWP